MRFLPATGVTDTEEAFMVDSVIRRQVIRRRPPRRLPRWATRLALVGLLGLGLAGPAAAQSDPLPSWNAGPVKQGLMTFVQAVSEKSGARYVMPESRIAVFDNDGTLWSEQPLYFQLVFALDRVREMAPQHPEWKTKWAYDRKSAIGRLDKALDEAEAKGWTVVDMKRDWKVVYPFQK